MLDHKKSRGYTITLQLLIIYSNGIYKKFQNQIIKRLKILKLMLIYLL